jgi:hypothetical protein
VSRALNSKRIETESKDIEEARGRYLLLKLELLELAAGGVELLET